MMGKQTSGQERLFYGFNFESHVPQDHLLRGIDHFLDLGDLRQHLANYYSSTGRPSIDPELMIRMLVIGYCFGIRSERRQCEEVLTDPVATWTAAPGGPAFYAYSTNYLIDLKAGLLLMSRLLP